MIILLLFIACGYAGLVNPPYWQQTPHIQVFRVAVVASTSTYTGSFVLAYPSTTYNISRSFTVAPKVLISIPRFACTTYYYNHDIYVSIIAAGSVTIYADFSTYGVGYLDINVMLYAAQVQNSIQHVTNYTPSIGAVTSTLTGYSFLVPLVNTITNMSHRVIIIPYITGIFQIYSTYGVLTTVNLVTNSTIRVNYNFSINSNVGQIRSIFLVIDVTLLQSTRTLYVDHYVLSVGAVLSAQYNSSHYNYNSNLTYIPVACRNQMFGYSGFYGTYSYTPYLYFTCQVTTSIGYETRSMTSVGYSVTNFRVRSCDPGTPYYEQVSAMCYQVCPDRYYAVPVYVYCLPCNYSCLSCNDNGTFCLSCASTDHRRLIITGVINVTNAGNCSCLTGYYDDGTNNSICTICHYTCLSCSNTSTQCTQCNQYRQYKSNNTCPCITGYTDGGSTANCTEICGDGIKFTLACDDGNTASGDGCSSTCTIEINFSCRQSNTTSTSFCSYNQSLVFTVLTMVTNNSTFLITSTVSVAPILAWMSTYNFSRLVSNDSDVNITSSSFSAGIITYTFKYSDRSDGNTVAMIFASPDTTSNTSTTFALPNSNFTFAIPALVIPVPPPQIPGYLSTVTKLLYAMTAVNLIVYLIGGLKLAYVQTMWTLQISYFCLLGSYYVQPLQEVFKAINVAGNGYNRMYFESINTNTVFPELATFDYRDQFLGNFNVMLIIQLSIILISVLFYGLAKVPQFIKGRYIFIVIHAFLLYDITLSFTLFNILNSSFAMGLQILFFIEVGMPQMSYLNIIGMVLSFSITVIIFCLFIFRNNQFINNVGIFKHEKRYRLHPLVMLSVRFAMGFTMGILYRHWYSGIVVMAIQIGYGISISVKNPYTLPFLLRAILNQGTILQNLIVGLLYKTVRINESAKGGLVPLWIQTFLLGVTCLTSLFYMIYTLYIKIRNLRHNDKVEIEEDLGFSQGGKGGKGIKKQRQVELDHNLTDENIFDNKMEISEIGFFDGRSTENKKMKGAEY